MARRRGGIERADVGQAPIGAPARQVHDRHVVQRDALQQLVRAKVKVQVFSRIDAHERRGLGGVYCRSYTATELTAAPFASVPVWLTVSVFPSFETDTFAVTLALPAFFQTFS